MQKETLSFVEVDFSKPKNSPIDEFFLQTLGDSHAAQYRNVEQKVTPGKQLLRVPDSALQTVGTHNLESLVSRIDHQAIAQTQDISTEFSVEPKPNSCPMSNSQGKIDPSWNIGVTADIPFMMPGGKAGVLHVYCGLITGFSIKHL